ncbi:hypothetical protein GW916_03410 [bacterium]|nr:hypothetical protein [bacterium]
MHNESNGEWIDLHSFSKKYGVSLSTLRRRIRSKSIEFKLMKGRYWLPDTTDVMSNAPLFSRKADLEEVTIPNQTVRTTEFAGGPRPQDVARIQELETENRKIRAQMAELQTLVGILETELGQLDSNRSSQSNIDSNL